MGMTQKAGEHAAAKSGGMIVVIESWSAPTTKKQFIKREEKAAANFAEHRALGRVKVAAESTIQTEKGDVFLFKVAGQVNRDVHEGGVYLTKKGEPCVDVVVMAPTEYGYTVACPYAGKEGSACENRRPFHSHRTINLTRLVSWVIAGEPQPLG
jgi:hypothetical protein